MQVRTDEPVAACMASQYAGWQVAVGKFFAMGSGPMRAAWGREKLFDDAERGANATLTVDLENQEIRGPDGGTVKFEIDPFRKHCLLNGLDAIGLTLEKKQSIEKFEQSAATARPWL